MRRAGNPCEAHGAVGTPPRAVTAGRAAALGLAVALLGGVPTAAQEEDEETGWQYTGELTAVWVGGNSESNTFGLGNTLLGQWERSTIKLTGGALRSESTTSARRAVGSMADFMVIEEESTRKTAERYFLRGRYDYRFSDRFFVFGGAEWLRNTFAGIDARWLGVVGLGNVWIDGDRVHFSTDYGVTITKQDDVVPNPDTGDTFAGARAAYDFQLRLTDNARFESVFIGDLNLDDTDDVRFDMTNALPINISSRLALKPSLQLLWRNAPALESLPLVASDGSPTSESVLVPLEELDTLFTLALVLSL